MNKTVLLHAHRHACSFFTFIQLRFGEVRMSNYTQLPTRYVTEETLLL